ncbi:MAG TPA: hypothetical protein VGO29_01020, partial [Solirubrobacteraceae bacterium]|nr:hypothetical protein [Solirubrobacteraceae bacterium]
MTEAAATAVDAADEQRHGRTPAPTVEQPVEGHTPSGPLRSQEIVVLDYGGQYSQLIARRVRDCGVFSELLPHTVALEEIAKRKPRGIILSGGP